MQPFNICLHLTPLMTFHHSYLMSFVFLAIITSPLCSVQTHFRTFHMYFDNVAKNLIQITYRWTCILFSVQTGRHLVCVLLSNQYESDDYIHINLESIWIVEFILI